MYGNTTGNSNSAYGSFSLGANTTGQFNSSFGVNSLAINSVGRSNSAFGASSLASNTTGYSNTAIGYQSLNDNQTGFSNVALGAYALYHSGNGSNLVAIGDSVLFNNSFGGIENTGVGSKALFSNTSGNGNTSVGIQTLYSNNDGSGNVTIGAYSLRSNTSGGYNTSSGYASMNHNTTGTYNAAYGDYALWGNADGVNNSAFGTHAMTNATSGGNNTALGAFALNSNADAGTLNTGVGYGAAVGSGHLVNATAIGSVAYADCSYCLVLGAIEGINGAYGSVNVGIGTSKPAKKLEVVGPASQTPVTLVIGNRGGFGPAALEFVSDYAGPNQWRPGFIRSNDLGGFAGSLEFFTNGTGPANLYGSLKGFEVRNGSALTATGSVGSYSDVRLKNNITAFTDGLNVIRKINPVLFYYNADAPFKTDRQQVGVIAQELEKIAPYMIEKNTANGYTDLRTVNNQAYTFLLINAIKEQQSQIESQQNKINKQESDLEKLRAQVSELKKLVEQILSTRTAGEAPVR